MKKLFIIFMISMSLSGQEITLKQCLDQAVLNHPLAPITKSIEDSYELRSDNLKSKHYPEIFFNGQVTYQDPVIEVNYPGFSSLSNDQYKTWIDLKQNIYDGGYVKKSMQIEKQEEITQLLEQEISIDNVKFLVTEIYFNILVFNKQIEQTEITGDELNKRLNNIKSLVSKGVILQKDYDGLKAEYLKLNQKMISLINRRQGIIKVLKRYIGISQDDSLILVIPEINTESNDDIQRKEYQLFKANIAKIDSYQRLSKVQSIPKVYGFTQVGYGKPGLNMLNNSFETYYIIGAGLTWNIFDWNRTKRTIQLQKIQMKNITIQKNNFDLTINVAIDKQKAEIKTYEQLLISDNEIIDLYQSMEQVAASQFENGTINSTEYLAELNKEKQAILAHEIHKLKHQQALITLNLLTGKL